MDRSTDQLAAGLTSRADAEATTFHRLLVNIGPERIAALGYLTSKLHGEISKEVTALRKQGSTMSNLFMDPMEFDVPPALLTMALRSLEITLAGVLYEAHSKEARND
jgi:hypothetical protein